MKGKSPERALFAVLESIYGNDEICEGILANG